MTTETLRPEAAGDLTQWTPSAGNNYACVSDQSDLTYVKTDTNLKEDLYGIADLVESNPVISSVKIYVRAKSDTYASQFHKFRIKLKTGGTEYDNGTTLTLTGSIVDYSWEKTTNPKTGNAWTKDEVDALQVGQILYANIPPTYYAYVYEVWVIVTYRTPVAYKFNLPLVRVMLMPRSWLKQQRNGVCVGLRRPYTPFETQKAVNAVIG